MLKRLFPFLILVLAGCGKFPNPNNIQSVDITDRAETAYRLLEGAEATLDFKVNAAEISDIERMNMIRNYAEELLKSIQPKAVPAEDQWMYAALLRVTGRWKEAETALETAVRAASTTDRKVNDTLKLAQAEAQNGKVETALATARSVMNVDDRDAVPILPAVLFEIVPAAEGKGFDKELSKLLSEAIDTQQRVVVDRNTDEGRAFLITRPDRIRRAVRKMQDLSESSH